MDKPHKLSRHVSDLRLEAEFLESSIEHLVRRPDHSSLRERWRSHPQKPVLGQGSYGVVRLEESESNPGELRAVKQIKKSDTKGHAIDYARELEAIVKFSHSELKHRFVCSGGWFENDASIFIVMEYLMNGDLNDYIKDPLPESEAKVIVRQILEGLNHMHSNGFIHRDLKPGNIMVATKGPAWEVKIADFGVSKERHLTSISPNTFYIGTLGYAAPEQLAVGKLPDSPVNGNEADLWSVGIITFRILTGELPFLNIQVLSRYTFGKVKFPVTQLDSVNASRNAERFILGLLVFQPHERMLAQEALSHPWVASIVESGQTKLSLRSIDSGHTYSSYSSSQVSEFPSARWTDVWDSAQVLPNSITPRPEEEQEQPRQPQMPLLLAPIEEVGPSPNILPSNPKPPPMLDSPPSLPRAPPTPPLLSPRNTSPSVAFGPIEKPSVLKRHLRSAQIEVSKNLVKAQDYEQAAPLLKQLLGIYSELESQEQNTTVDLAALAFIETNLPMEEARLYFDENDQFRLVYMHSQVWKVKEWCGGGRYEQAVPSLKMLLRAYNELDSEQQKIVVELSALVFIETIVPVEEMFYQNSEFRIAYENLRFEKVEEWFLQSRPHDIVKLLEYHQALKLPRWSPSQSSEYDNIDLEIRLRMRLASCFNSMDNPQQARGLLENLLIFMAHTHNQRAAVHIMLSETLSSERYKTDDGKWRILAKEHAEEAAKLYMDSLGLSNPGTLTAVTMVANLSEELGDPDHKAWGQILVDVRHRNRLEELKKHRSTWSKRGQARAFLECQIKMMEVARMNPDEAVRVGLNYLRSNFSITYPQNFCERCAEEYFRRGNFSWIATAPLGRDFCEHDPSIKMTFSPLHFFAFAVHKKATGRLLPHCIQEISCILSISDKEHMINHAILYGDHRAGQMAPITPLWVAALWGDHRLMDFLLSRNTIKPDIGFLSIKRLGFDNSLREGNSGRVVAVLDRISRSELEICLKDPSFEEKSLYPHWPWCFKSGEILRAVLKKLGAGGGGVKVPWRFESHSGQFPDEVKCSLLIILLGFPIAKAIFPMSRKTAFELLLEYGADMNGIGPRLNIENQPVTLNAVNALGMGLINSITRLEELVFAQLSQSSTRQVEVLCKEIKMSVTLTDLVIEKLSMFPRLGVLSSSSNEWNSFWQQVTIEFFDFESQTRVVGKRDKLLHRIGKPKRPRLGSSIQPISLPERLGSSTILGVARDSNEDWRRFPEIRDLLENHIAETLKKTGCVDKTVSFDNAGPYYN